MRDFLRLEGNLDSASKRATAPQRRGTRRRLARAVAATPVAIEMLESRRLMSVSITGSVTLDESPGLQTSGVVATGEDNNDNDVALSALPTSFSNRLFSAPTAGLGLSSSLASTVGVGKSADNYITVTGGGTITSLGFAKADGTALPVYGGAQPGVASGLSAVSGGAISLFRDSALGSRMVLGVDTNGEIAMAMFLDPAAGLASAKVWTVQIKSLANPVTTNPDDPLTLTGLGIAAGSSTEFNFSALPSGQNLFGTVGSTTAGLVVIGKTPVLNADGTYTNASNTINTSQGGGPTTIGVNNQMFDAGEGAYFTYVKNPVANFLAGAPNGLDQGEADDADNIQYTGGTTEANSAFTKISQIQGGSLATMSVTAFNMAGSPQGQTFAKTGLGTGATAAITAVRVYNAAGTKIEDSALPGAQDPNVGITITNGVATVSGLNAGYKIEWDTSTVHDQVLIGAVAGKFDIGGFGVNEPTSQAAPLTGVRFEDAGPTIGPIQNSIVDFVNGATITKSLNGVVGSDEKTDPYTIDSFTASVTVNGIEVRGVLAANKQSVTYYANTNGDATFGNTGDTPYYRLTLSQSGSGTYKFDVLFTPPPADLSFNFDALPSGQNLFGTVGSTSSGLVVIGKTPVLNADGTYTNASNTINTSQGGGPTTIGINNQMFDAGDGAYFTYVKNPVANFLAGAPNGLDQGEADDADNIQYTGGTLEATGGFVKISQIQGGGLATMQIKAFDMAGAPQGQTFAKTGLGTGTAVSITAVRVYNAAGTKVEDSALPGAQDPNVAITISSGVATVSGLNAGYKIQWDTSAKHDQVLITGVAGKFDVGGFGVVQSNPIPDQKLDFVVRVVDGDGDSDTASFSIGIDGTGIFDDGVVIL
jgi:hypothetical protein